MYRHKEDALKKDYPIPCLPLCPTQTPRPSSDAIPPATRRWLTHSRRGSNRRWRAGARVGWMAKEGMMAELVALEGVRAGVQVGSKPP
ncbi:uncharacterized protein LOC135106234 isoform X7 [Scylla paramamosain]|uniref:uncharacterized protein LOC135106234 isoform X7 n=1 Tax=Scylla paramamosain TaxID=85552 RepID=UPI003082FAB8